MMEDTRGVVRLGMPCELIAHRPSAKAAKIVNVGRLIVLTTTCQYGRIFHIIILLNFNIKDGCGTSVSKKKSGLWL